MLSLTWNASVASTFFLFCFFLLGNNVRAQPPSLTSPLLNLRGIIDPGQTAPLSKVFSQLNGVKFPIVGQPTLPVASLFGGPKKTSNNLDEIMYPIAQENFKRWNDALKSKDYEKVASLYSTTDLSFLPTVSAELVRDGPTTKEYFAEFLKKHPVGTITEDVVQAFGEDAYLHSGMYTFMTGPDDARKPVDARFSFMWRKIDGMWKIVHHHSSALPKDAGAEDQKTKDEAMYPIAQENFKKWNDALQTEDYETVASLYSSTDLSFLPTVSADFIQSTPATEAYFKEFLKKLPYGTITADKVQSFGNEAYLHSGMYTFMVGPDNNRTPVEARFSYMWRKIDGVWKIVHHHSSKLPEQ